MTTTCEDLAAPASPPIRLADLDSAPVEFLIDDVARQIMEGGADSADRCHHGYCGCHNS